MGAAGDMLMAALLELIPDKQAFIDRMNGLGLSGAVCNMAGSWVGSGLAISKGARIVRPVILLVLVLLLAKILFDF